MQQFNTKTLLFQFAVNHFVWLIMDVFQSSHCWASPVYNSRQSTHTHTHTQSPWETKNRLNDERPQAVSIEHLLHPRKKITTMSVFIIRGVKTNTQQCVRHRQNTHTSVVFYANLHFAACAAGFNLYALNGATIAVQFVNNAFLVFINFFNSIIFYKTVLSAFTFWGVFIL